MHGGLPLGAGRLVNGRLPEKFRGDTNRQVLAGKQRGLCAPQRMRAIGRWVQPNSLNPGPDNPGILSSRKMRRLRHATRKKELLWLQMRRSDPGCDGVPRLLGDLKLDRPLGLLLHDNRAGGDPTSVDHIVDAEANQIAAA